MSEAGRYYLHSAVLACLACARPLFAKFEAQPEFLVAHEVLGAPLVLFALLAVLLPLLPVWILLALAGLGGRSALHAAFLGLVFILGTLIALPPANTVFADGGAALAVGLTAGALLSFLYQKFQVTRLFLSYLSPAVLIVPGYFLFASPAGKLLEPARAYNPDLVPIEAAFPIVLLVFDEFPALSLLDGRGAIDAERFPNFSRLASTATWFPNATTVAESTTRSIPALLTGREARVDAAPIQLDHPGNLFDRLAGAYRIRAHESGTALCRHPCMPLDQTGEPIPTRVRALARDVAIVWLHLVTPEHLRAGLPDISTDWRDFGHVRDEMQADHASPGNWGARAVAARVFAVQLELIEQNSFFYFHSLLPHYAWDYLPDGRRYSLPDPGGVFGVVSRAADSGEPNRWMDDDWLPIQAYRRYLLQLGFVDTLIGEFLQALSKSGRFDETLLIVTADHGGAFNRQASRRSIGELNIAEIANVPLFIKLPGQYEGVVDERAATLLDVFPTLMDLLEADSGVEAVGSSLLADTLVRGELAVTRDNGEAFRFDIDRLLRSRSQSGEKLRAATGTGPFRQVYSSGTVPGLFGRSPADLAPRPSGVTVVIEERHRLADVLEGDGFVYANIRGIIPSLDRDEASWDVAVALNGTICGTTRSYARTDGGHGFRALVDPACLRAGFNEIDVYRIREGQLEHLALDATENFSLDLENLAIHGTRGDSSYPIVDDASLGWFGSYPHQELDSITIGGWAANMTDQRPAGKVIIFVDGKSVAVLGPRLPRPGEAESFAAPGILNSGFQTSIPDSLAGPEFEIRAFGVYDGRATELYVAESENNPWLFRKIQPAVPARIDRPE